jgi:hypothetical protein
LPSIVPCSPSPAQSLCIRPLAISAAVRTALEHGDPIVQAGHRRGASLAMPGTDDAVFMSAPGMGLFPAHIVVRASDLERVLDAVENTGVEAAESGEALSLHIDVGGVRTFRSGLARNPAGMRSTRARANVAAVAQWLRACPAPLGLGATASALLAPEACWRKSLLALQRGTHPAESVLRSLVGYGAGATPAGDDFAIGALAFAWVTQGREAPLIAAMRLLGTELPALTSTAGATYLRAAARGEFGSHLVAWVRALPRASPPRALALARRVADHGATSGYDTLLGFVAAAEAADAALASAPVERRFERRR